MVPWTGNEVAVWITLTVNLLLNPAAGNWLGRTSDNTKYAYGCLTSGSIEITCGQYEIITISEVAYGGEPKGCGQEFTQQNDCQQPSKTILESAKTRCDGKPRCDVPIRSLQSEELRSDDVTPVRDGCDVGSQYYAVVTVNYMVVKYTCQGFLFCTDIDEVPVAGLTVRTKDFPETTITNPTCDCNFQAEGDTTYLQMLAMCNGTVTFVLDEKIDNPDPSDNQDYVTVTNRYYCDNELQGKVLRMGTDNTVSMSLRIDTDNSSEFSSFSVNVRVLVKKFNNNQVSFRSKQNGRALVSCNKGALWLSKTVKLLLAILIPLGVLLLVTLIVVCRCVKRRRKRAKEWRRKNVSLRGTSYEPAFPDMPLHIEPTSPTDSNTSSLPSYTRRKPDGKMDSESDDDELARVAAKLHRKNTERRADELRKRVEYYNNNGGPAGSFSGLPQHMTMSKSCSHHHDLDHHPNKNRKGDDGQGVDRRCMSIGSLLPADDDNGNNSNLPHYRMNRSRSVSQPRSRTRSNRPPDSPIYANNNRRHKPRNIAGQDPDLTFDDPRYTNRSRACTPVRDSQRRLYADDLSRSTASLGYSARGGGARPQRLYGTRSASQSRTSLRSMKRRAPLPPGHSPVSQTTSNQRAVPGTPLQNRASPLKPRDQRYNQSNPANSGSVNYAKNNKKNNTSSGKSKFANPYPVRYPPRKSKPKSHDLSEDTNDGADSALILGSDLPKSEGRRYSDGGSHDESDHGMDETPVELFGMEDNDDMYDDGGW